jgi:hypothetical protein
MTGVMTLHEMDLNAVESLLAGFGLQLVMLSAGEEIPGTYWGAPEAGLSGDQLFARPDTPVHSVLHEAAHFLCMGKERRAQLHRDAGGDVAEEDAVCYLQILLGARIEAPGWSRARHFADMDAWGYSFRLGSTQRWFEDDADEARAWLASKAPNLGFIGCLEFRSPTARRHSLRHWLWALQSTGASGPGRRR